MSANINREELKEVEQSPVLDDGIQYIRFDFQLGKGSYKEVWLAYNTGV
jgi:hypothetical protein